VTLASDTGMHGPARKEGHRRDIPYDQEDIPVTVIEDLDGLDMTRQASVRRSGGTSAGLCSAPNDGPA
jgi:hypothetical protein